VRQYIEWVEERHEPRPERAIDWKLATVSGSELFHGLSVRETAELVTLSPGSPISPLEHTAPHVSPADFHRLLAEEAVRDPSDPAGSPLVLLDVRNGYESAIGRFEAPNVDTLRPPLRKFSELPRWLEANVHVLRGRRVLMYCPGA